MVCKMGSCDVKYMKFVVNDIKYAKSLAYPFNTRFKKKTKTSGG